MKSGVISHWTDTDQLQNWSSHSSSTNNHLLVHYLFVYNGNVNIFTVCHSRQVNVAAWFLVLPIDIENPYLLLSGWCWVLRITFYRSLPLYIKIYRVGNNWTTVNMLMTPHISDQLGTKNACKILLCWLITMIWVLVCNNMYRYEHCFGFFYCNPTILEPGFRDGFHWQ